MRSSLSRRSFLRSAALGSAALTLGSRLAAQPAKLPRKANLLVFLPDQQRTDTIACYGGVRVHAPNLNKLASESVVFERAYVTHPICTPSRSSLMTGTWPHTNGCTRNNMLLDARYLALPELIADPDYRTGYMGKWHLGDEMFAQRGFEEWVSTEDTPHSVSKGRAPRALSDYGKFLVSKNLKPDKKNGSFSRKFPSKLPIELSKPRFLETHACDFIERHRREPFLLFVAFFEPHPPYNGPLNEEHPLDQVDLDASATQTFGADMPLRYRLRQEDQQKRFGTTPMDYRKIKQKYLGLVTEIDRSIGAILSTIERLGLADNTIVVHTSDHGDMMGAHRLFEKGVMFRESACVPYLVHMPGQRRSISIAQPSSHIDFLPTVLHLLGKPAPTQCAGKSRVPLLRGEALLPETIFVEWAPNGEQVKKGTTLASPEEIQQAINESTRAAISPEGWKLCLRDNDKHELYNLRADSGEEHNLYYDRQHGDVIAQLTGEIHRWQELVGDTVKV